MINLIKGKELLSTVADDITNKVAQKSRTNFFILKKFLRVILCVGKLKKIIFKNKFGVFL